ncbi:MAG: helix-turn-helix domain-containing protein [Tepidisphaeraceae bacterium]
MVERTISSSLAGDVVDLLLKRGMTLTAIAQATGTTKSFLSRVKSRTRGLTIDHLLALEDALGEPLPLLLLQATPIESVPKHLRPLYRSTAKILGGGRGKTTRAPQRRSKAA